MTPSSRATGHTTKTPDITGKTNGQPYAPTQSSTSASSPTPMSCLPNRPAGNTHASPNPTETQVADHSRLDCHITKTPDATGQTRNGQPNAPTSSSNASSPRLKSCTPNRPAGSAQESPNSTGRRFDPLLQHDSIPHISSNDQSTSHHYQIRSVVRKPCMSHWQHNLDLAAPIQVDKSTTAHGYVPNMRMAAITSPQQQPPPTPTPEPSHHVPHTHHAPVLPPLLGDAPGLSSPKDTRSLIRGPLSGGLRASPVASKAIGA